MGNLFVVVAPSGAGKTTLVEELLKRERNIRLSVSYTTRAPRPGEMDGREYHFIDRARFDKKMIAIRPEPAGIRLDASGRSLTIEAMTRGRTKYELTLSGTLELQILGCLLHLTFEILDQTSKLIFWNVL